jgi:hypothetical protein
MPTRHHGGGHTEHSGGRPAEHDDGDEKKRRRRKDDGDEDGKKRDKDSGDSGDSGGDSGGGSGGDPGSGGSYGAAGFDDGASITDTLQPPEDTSGEDIEALIQDAGVEVLAVEWVYQKLTGTTLTQQFIEPITGDFSKISADAQAWRNISESMKAFSVVMSENEKVLGESWTGPAALAHRAYVDIGWKAGLAAEAAIAELIAKGFDLLADTSRKLAAKALDLLKSLIDRLLVMAAEACVPIAGWIADAITALSEILPLIDALISIVEMIKDIVEKVGDLWNSLKDIGSQLARIKDVQGIGDLADIGKSIAGDVGDIKDDATIIKDDASEIGKTAKEATGRGDDDEPDEDDRKHRPGDHTSSQGTHPDGPAPQQHQTPPERQTVPPHHPTSAPHHVPRRPGSGRISGRID